MRLRTNIQIVLTLAILPGIGLDAFACEFAAQRIVAQKTAGALPDALAAFYANRIDLLTERAIEPGGVWMRDPGMRVRKPWHHLMIDVAAAGPEHEQRMSAAAAFPSSRREARAVFRAHNAKGAGKVIWVLDDLVAELSDAMRSGDADEVVRISGYIVHFSADAANPFHATRNVRGEESGNPVFVDCPMGDPLFAHQDVAHRVGWELVARNAGRYADAIDVDAVRFEIVDDVPFAALERMVESLDNLHILCEADRSILAQMEIDEGVAFLARHDEYYELMDEACGRHVVENLCRGVRLATTLLVTAWFRADSPDLLAPPVVASQSQPSTAPTEAPAEAAETSGNAAPQVSAGLVASKNSKVFHSADCSHAHRISEKNAIRFGTAEEAAATGRRPCKSCNPSDDSKGDSVPTG